MAGWCAASKRGARQRNGSGGRRTAKATQGDARHGDGTAPQGKAVLRYGGAAHGSVPHRSGNAQLRVAAAWLRHARPRNGRASGGSGFARQGTPERWQGDAVPRTAAQGRDSAQQGDGRAVESIAMAKYKATDFLRKDRHD